MEYDDLFLFPMNAEQYLLADQFGKISVGFHGIETEAGINKRIGSYNEHCYPLEYQRLHNFDK